jgi:hypothetical protein
MYEEAVLMTTSNSAEHRTHTSFTKCDVNLPELSTEYTAVNVPAEPPYNDMICTNMADP